MAKITHMAMCTKNNRRLARFYRLVFGMEEVWNAFQNSPYAFYIGDGHFQLNCLQIRPGSSYNKWVDGREILPGVGIHHIGIWVESLAGAEKRLGELEPPVKLESSPQDGRYEEKRFMDPDGNLFEISEGGWDAGPSKAAFPLVRYVSLNSREPERLADFYKTAFGFKEASRSRTGGSASAVFLSDGTLSFGIVNDPSFERQGLRSLGFQVKSIEEIRDRIVKSPPFLYPGEPPIEIVRSPEPYYDQMFYLKDPDRNLVEITEQGWEV